MCQAIKSLMIIAGKGGTKLFRVKILKTGDGGGGAILNRGLVRAFCCWSTRGPQCLSARVKETWDDCILNVCALSRKIHGVELDYWYWCHKLPTYLGLLPGMFPAWFSTLSAGLASPERCGSAFYLTQSAEFMERFPDNLVIWIRHIK